MTDKKNIKNIAHSVNATLVGTTPLDFKNWEFVDPQGDQRQSIGKDASLNDFVNITGYTHFWDKKTRKYQFFEPQTDQRVFPGSPSMHKDHYGSGDVDSDGTLGSKQDSDMLNGALD